MGELKQACHTDSYYASTCTIPCYPPLEGVEVAEVCVIGGGFSGVNTAIELAQKGVSVVLIESSRIGWGASGRNGGQLIQGIGHDVSKFSKLIGNDGVKALKVMGIEAVDIVRQRIEMYSIDCDLVWGYCDLANKLSHLEDFQSHLDELSSLGYKPETRLLTKKDIQGVVGSEAYVGGLVDMGSGHLHPLKLILAEAEIARGLGVKIFEDTCALKLDSGGGSVLVETSEGRIVAKKIVIACNAHINGLESTLSGKVLPAGSYVIATEPLPPETQHQLSPRNMAMSDNQVGLNYFRLSADGRLLFGGACHYSGRDPRDIAGYMTPTMLKVFPYLSSTKIEFAWGGMIGIGANRMPQVGQLKGRPEIYYAQAYSGHGLNATHLAGKLLAEAITGEASTGFELLNSIPHMTFPGGPILRSPLLAMGMLWQRMKEIGR